MTEENAAAASGSPPQGQFKPIEVTELMRYLPHRYPFLMVDRIVHMDGSRHVIGIKNVTINEPQFQGHFPGQPVLPGVLIIEGMAQTAGAACVASGDTGGVAKVVYFMTIDNCRFRKPIIPGDRCEYHLTLLKRRRNMWWFKGEAKVDGIVCAEAELGAMIVTE